MDAQARSARVFAVPSAMADKLRPNLFSQATVRQEGGRPVELRLWCVTKSRGAVTRNFARGRNSNFERIYEAVAGSRAAPEKPLSDLVSSPRLACGLRIPDLIDPVYLHAPLRSRLDGSMQSSPLEAYSLRGEVWLQEGAEPPSHLSALPLGCLSQARPILWHQGAAGEPLLPWWPTAECLAAVAALQGLAPRRPDMLPALQSLAEQGVAVRKSAAGRGEAETEPNLEVYRDFFSQHGFAFIRRLLPPGQIAALRSYWQKLAALDVIPDRGDGGARRGSHGEPSSALLLHLLQPLIAGIVGSEIKPAYSYAWIYRRGAEMPPHLDREACRCTVTVLVDYAPAVDGPTPWPLCVHPRGGDAPLEIRQSVGDAIIFNGRELKHFRPPFTVGTQSTSLLLHYVDCKFAGVMF